MEHRDKFRVYFGDIKPEKTKDSIYSYRRGIGKNYWITKKGNDFKHFTDFAILDSELKKLRKEEENVSISNI